jgi:hypothetical protein
VTDDRADAAPTEPVYHVSDRGDIEHFEPRPSPSPQPSLAGPVVWAVGERLLHNYLVPRDCPRVTFYAGPHTLPADAERLMAGTSARHVVAIEAGWLPALRSGRLFLYRMPSATFRPIDPGAGYYVSPAAVAPLEVRPVDDLLAALVARRVELRVMPSLHKLRDAVVASTLQFSIIRWRNAAPPEAGDAPPA